MKKTDFLIGFTAAIVATFIGIFLFLELFTDYGFIKGLGIMKSFGYIGNVIKLGAILNLILFLFFIKLKKDNMAKGVLLATIILAITTLFI